MKKRSLLIAVFTAVSMALAACATQNIAVTGIELSEKQIMVAVGESVTINAMIAPEDASNREVLWSSADEAVATVKNGMVKGSYKIPESAGIIRVKITDVLSESLEVEVQNG